MRVESTLRKGIALSILAVTLGIQSANAQYASSPQARELLSALQDTHSMVKVGINAIEYNRVARDLQVKLDRFLRMPDAMKHPAGGYLKKSVESFIIADDNFKSRKGPQANWIKAEEFLSIAEQCITTGKECRTIEQLDLETAQLTKERQQLAQKYSSCLKIDSRLKDFPYGLDVLFFSITNNCNVSIKNADIEIESTIDKSEVFIYDLKTMQTKEESAFIKSDSGIKINIKELSVDN
jgi:hypothetical protein